MGGPQQVIRFDPPHIRIFRHRCPTTSQQGSAAPPSQRPRWAPPRCRCLVLLGSSAFGSMLARSLGRVAASSARHVRVSRRTCVSSFMGGCSWGPSSMSPSSANNAATGVFPQKQQQQQSQQEKAGSYRRYLSSKKRRPSPGAGEEEEEDVDGMCRCCPQA